MAKAVLFIVFLLGLTPLVAEEKFVFDSTPRILPKDIVPHSYSIEFRPDIATMKTKGSETIALQVRRATKQIVLNAVGTSIEHASLKDGNGTEQGLQIRNDEAAQTVTLSVSNELSPGNYELRLEFTSSIEQSAQGLHVQSYKVNGQEKTLLATQMEPCDARRMFPCWDEPVFRATFQISCITSANNVVISNMPIAKDASLPNSEKRVEFAVTPA